MEVSIISGLSSLLGVAVGGLISYFFQRQKNDHEFNLKHQDNKTANIPIIIKSDERGRSNRTFIQPAME